MMHGPYKSLVDADKHFKLPAHSTSHSPQLQRALEAPRMELPFQSRKGFVNVGDSVVQVIPCTTGWDCQG